jgi:hypothetical protein
METNVDLIGINGGEGEVANRFLANGQLNLGSMRPFYDVKTNRNYISIYNGGEPKDPKSYSVQLVTNATLRRDEWKQLDAAIMEPARYRLGGVADLIDSGLTFNLGNAMGTTVLEWHDVSEAMEASLTMDGVTRSPGDRPKFQHNYLPIPIIHVDYEINARVLASSRSLGNPLDTTSAERAARRVAEKLENMLFTDTEYSFGEKDNRSRNTIYSYVNHPDRNIVNLSIPWDNSAITGAGIIQDVLELKQSSIDNYHYGPWKLYIPTSYETVLDDDYDATTPGTTIRERIMKINGISGIKIVDTLTADNILLVQMTPDVVRLVRGMGLQNVEWGTEGNMITKYKVMTIQVPQIRSDQNGKSGIVHCS